MKSKLPLPQTIAIQKKNLTFALQMMYGLYNILLNLPTLNQIHCYGF